MSNGSINYQISIATGTAMQVLSALRDRLGSLGKIGSNSLRLLTSPVAATVKGMGALNQAIEGVGKLLTPLSAIKDGFVDVATAAAKMESTNVAFKVMIGDAEKAKSVLADLVKLGADTPFEFTDLAQAGQLLLNFGVQADQLTDTLRRLGDVSAVRNNLSSIATIFGQVKSKGKLQGDELMQFNEAGVPMLAELAKMLKMDEAAVTALVEAGKIGFPLVNQAFSNMTAEGGKFFGMMAEQSKTTSGVWSNLQDKLGQLKVILGEPINDAIRPILNDMIGYAETLKPKLKEIGESIRDWALYIREAFKGGYGFEALLAPLKLGLLEAANSFAIKMGLVFAQLQVNLAMSNPLTTLEEKIERIKEIMQGKNVGPFAAEIEGVKNRMGEMAKQAKDASEYQQMLNKAYAEGDAVVAAFGKEVEKTNEQTKKVEGYEKAFKVAKGSEGKVEGKQARAMLDYAKAVEIADLKLKGMNAEAEKLEKERQLREKIADIIEKTGASYEEASKAAKKLLLAEQGAPERKTGTQIADEKRAKSRNARDLERAANRAAVEERREARKEAAKNPFGGLDWLEKGGKRVDKALAKPEPKKDAAKKSDEAAALEKIYNMLDSKLATV